MTNDDKNATLILMSVLGIGVASGLLLAMLFMDVSMLIVAAVASLGVSAFLLFVFLRVAE
jgi:hypothetical protein